MTKSLILRSCFSVSRECGGDNDNDNDDAYDDSDDVYDDNTDDVYDDKDDVYDDNDDVYDDNISTASRVSCDDKDCIDGKYDVEAGLRWKRQ